jgi:hypothetical protein
MIVNKKHLMSCHELHLSDPHTMQDKLGVQTAWQAQARSNKPTDFSDTL